jgi:hypothetical protein
MSVEVSISAADEAPVYNSHLFGFYSVFNPDAVKDVQLTRRYLRWWQTFIDPGRG